MFDRVQCLFSFPFVLNYESGCSSNSIFFFDQFDVILIAERMVTLINFTQLYVVELWNLGLSY